MSDSFSQSLEDQVLSGNIFGESSAPAPRYERKAETRRTNPNAGYRDEKINEGDSNKIDDLYFGPDQIPLSHVLVVQPRFIRKAGAFEFSPISVAIQPADSFRKQLKWGVSLSYHFTESFGIELVHAMFVHNFAQDQEKNLFDFSNLRLDRIEPAVTLGSALLWSPLSSKTATDSSIWYFEGYFVLGGGMSRLGEEWAPMGMGGIGFKAYANESAIFKMEFRNYVDFGKETLLRPNIGIGLSLLLGNQRK